MGYAKLHFDTSGANTISHVMHDIVGVVTGTYTSTSQLTVATRSLSEIVNTLGSNWSFVYPATHGTKGNTNVSWVLSAPCVSSNTKLKYVRISGHVYNLGTSQVTTDLYRVSSSASSLGGVKMTSCTAAASNTSVTNETFYTTNTGAYQNNSGFYLMNGPYIVLSWSQRHLLMWGGASHGAPWDAGSSSANAIFACFETTETPISTYRNVAPFVHYNRGWYKSPFNSDTGFSTSLTIPADADTYNGSPLNYDVFLQMNHYNPTTATASGVHNVLSNINSQDYDMPIFGTSTVSAPSSFTKSSTGATAVYMQPLFYHQLHQGIPHMYISNLCDVWRVDDDIANNHDTFTVGANTYSYIKISGGSYGRPNSPGYALAVRKA